MTDWLEFLERNRATLMHEYGCGWSVLFGAYCGMGRELGCEYETDYFDCPQAALEDAKDLLHRRLGRGVL